MTDLAIPTRDRLTLLLASNQNVPNRYTKHNNSTRNGIPNQENVKDSCQSGPCPICGMYIKCWSCDLTCGKCGYDLVG